VSTLDVYVDNPSKWEQGHRLWRSLNAVVLLTEQMRQSEDPEFAAALRCIHVHKPTQADIDMLRTRVGTPLDYPGTIPIVVRRHKLCTALNADRLQEASQASGIPISHCARSNHRRRQSTRCE